MAQLLMRSGSQNFLHRRAVHIILVNESIYALTIKKILYPVSILPLPLGIFACPGIIQSDVHGDTPGIKAKSITDNPVAAKQSPVIIIVIRIKPGLGVDASMQILPAPACTLSPETHSAIVRPSCPYFIECRQMVRRIGKPFSPRVRSKCDQFLLQVDERNHTVHPGFLHGTVQNIPGLSQVIDTRIVAPAIGSED